ncbi:uncharacterized protein [Triticum aestivum]|uniref:uncharacterized protein n=1 Tax=Triticum aestivum TaxID=4565 RepID=UPI000843D7A9|nr:uncharacterized protein LOC123075691 [Triticum aestivum]
MDRVVCTSLVVLALAVLAGPGTKAAALAGGTASMDAGSTVRPQLMSATQSLSMKLEDGVAPELAAASVVNLEVHRRVLGEINPDVLGKDVCMPRCPAKGQPYTGHACKNIYKCPNT